MKHNKTLTKFMNKYGRNMDNMEFCPSDYMDSFTTEELIELKHAVKNKSIASKNPAVIKLFDKMQNIMFKQIVEEVKYVEKDLKEKARMEREYQILEALEALEKEKTNKLRKSLKNKLTKEELELLGF